ncbi:MFS transporter [Nonomuraea mesophila]|uniref:MFS transporter n=1 Tax=Nonomuraea mesophila TaxID=2530382 RepID=A0A4R5FT04_9ACTN|nr:MFS transporter [Nonomuraea mesophila]TDE56528.1 MFS transporter [Nonomuraea mesophila]
MQVPWTAPRRLRRVRETADLPVAVRLLLVNQFGVNVGFYLLVPYLATHLTGDLRMSVAATAIVLGVRNLAQQGLFIIGGTAADRLGARRVIIAGCGLRAAGFGLFAFGDGLAVLVAAAVLSGLAGALFNPAVRAYIAVEAPDRARAFALFNVFAQAGALCGPVLGAVLLLADFRVVAVTAALIFLVLTVAQALVLPARDVPPSGTSLLGDWRACLADRRFLGFALALSGMYALQNQLYLVLPLEAERTTGRPEAVAAVFVISTVVTLVLQVPITRFLDRRRGGAIAGGMAVMGLGFLAPALLPGPVPVLVAVLALAVGVMMAQPFVYDVVGSSGGPSRSGTYFGMFYMVSGVVAAVSTVVIGWAGPRGPLVCAAIGLTCAAGAAAHARRRAPEPS